MKSEKTKNLFTSKTARSIVVIVAVLLIGLAVYLNYRWFYDPVGDIGYGDSNMEDSLQGSLDVDADANTENDYFAATVLTRQQSRDEAIDVLKLATDSADATEETKAQAQEKGLAEDVKFYLEFFKYGCPPHGGFGLGIDRLTMLFLGLSIKEAEFLFRGPNRLTP